MKGRAERHEAIKRIIREKRVANQEELIAELKEIGFDLTQGALSKDLKSLSVYKSADAQGYFYAVPSGEENSSQGMLGSVTGVSFSRNLMVVRTLSGHASAVAGAIDRMNDAAFLGSIAGDDTVFVVLEEGVDRNVVLESVRKKLSF